METKEFALWLKGFADGIGNKGPNPEQWKKIQNQLGKCFNKVTPNRNFNEELKKKLSDHFPNANPNGEPVACGTAQSANPILTKGTILYC